MIAHYPQPFHERFPKLVRPLVLEDLIWVGPRTWQVAICGETWEIQARSVMAVLRQARQLQKLKREGVI